MGYLVIDLVAWDLRGRELHGFVELTGTRVSDMLLAGEPLNATDVTIVDHDAGAVERWDFLAIDPADLSIALATGPRGARALRQPSHGELAEIHVGATIIHGVLFTGDQPFTFDRAAYRPWLPVTDAVMERRLGGAFSRERFGTLILNRERIDTVNALSSSTHETRWLAAKPPVAWPAATLRPFEAPRRSGAAFVGSW